MCKVGYSAADRERDKILVRVGIGASYVYLFPRILRSCRYMYVNVYILCISSSHAHCPSTSEVSVIWLCIACFWVCVPVIHTTFTTARAHTRIRYQILRGDCSRSLQGAKSSRLLVTNQSIRTRAQLTCSADDAPCTLLFVRFCGLETIRRQFQSKASRKSCLFKSPALCFDVCG